MKKPRPVQTEMKPIKVGQMIFREWCAEVMKIGEVLSMARGISGKTLRDVERETGISNALLSQIETGHIKRPSFHSVVKIARVLNVKLDILAEHAVPDLKKILREMREAPKPRRRMSAAKREP